MQAGHSMFDAMAKISDLKASQHTILTAWRWKDYQLGVSLCELEVEQILLEVEARCGVTFNSAVRIKLWKAGQDQGIKSV